MKQVTPEQHHILREKGTERPFSGKLLYNTEKGTYHCAGCGAPLFSSETKFDSGCGWPSFDDAILGSITKHRDIRHGMTRTEIACARCGGHLGHLFKDGPTKKGLRYCINSLALEFKEAQQEKKHTKTR